MVLGDNGLSVFSRHFHNAVKCFLTLGLEICKCSTRIRTMIELKAGVLTAVGLMNTGVLVLK